MVKPGVAEAAWSKAAFEAKKMDAALSALGAGSPAESAEVQLTAPDIAENGAVVPVGVVSNLPDTEEVAILVEKNPNMLAARFMLPAGTEAAVQTRIKMGQTSDVYAVVKAGGKYHGQERDQGHASAAAAVERFRTNEERLRWVTRCEFALPRAMA